MGEWLTRGWGGEITPNFEVNPIIMSQIPKHQGTSRHLELKWFYWIINKSLSNIDKCNFVQTEMDYNEGGGIRIWFSCRSNILKFYFLSRQDGWMDEHADRFRDGESEISRDSSWIWFLFIFLIFIKRLLQKLARLWPLISCKNQI